MISRRTILQLPFIAFLSQYIPLPKKKPTVSESVDFLLVNCKDARWDIVARAMKTLETGFKRRLQDERTSW